MNRDKILFDPCILAILKGLVYLLAFFTTILIADVGERLYYFGIVVYCCGCICDYIEIAAYRRDKCKTTRITSGVVAVILGLIIITALAISGYFDDFKNLVKTLSSWSFLINLFFALFWAVPLYCGVLLMIDDISKDDFKNQRENNSKKHALGYQIKP